MLSFDMNLQRAVFQEIFSAKLTFYCIAMIWSDVVLNPFLRLKNFLTLFTFEELLIFLFFWREKKIAYHGRNVKKVDFKAVIFASRYGLAWFIPLYLLPFAENSTKMIPLNSPVIYQTR